VGVDHAVAADAQGEQLLGARGKRRSRRSAARPRDSLLRATAFLPRCGPARAPSCIPAWAPPVGRRRGPATCGRRRARRCSIPLPLQRS
jgi:hypothetical protein